MKAGHMAYNISSPVAVSTIPKRVIRFRPSETIIVRIVRLIWKSEQVVAVTKSANHLADTLSMIDVFLMLPLGLFDLM
jgi:hypothetical protein